MTMKRFSKGTALLMMLAMISVTACANNERGGRGNQQGFPPEAIKACEGKQEGDKVTFSGREGGSLTATCQTVEGQLVAVPEGHNR